MSTAETFERLMLALTEAARSYYQDRLVTLVIFGSVARGTARPDSDLDLFLVVEDLPVGRMARVAEFGAVEQALSPALEKAKQQGVATYLSPIFKTPEEALRKSPLFLDMTEDARLLVDRNDFFKGILGRMRERLKELGSRRVWRGTHWFWDLKPDFKPGDIIEL